MYRYIKLSIVILICLSLLSGLETSCAKHPFVRAQGTIVGSCKGNLKLTTGEKTRFVLNLIKNHEDDFKLYLSLSGKRVKYATVENLSFEDDIVKIEVTSPKRVYEGKITGNSIKFEGEWSKYSGSFKLLLDN